MFKLAFLLNVFGLILIFMGVFLSIIIPAWMLIFLMIVLVGVIVNILGLYHVYNRANQTTLIHLLEEPRRGEVNWLYVWGDREIEITPAIKKVGRTSYAKDLQQQINDLKTYRLGDHEVRVVPEGAQYSTDFKVCLYAEKAKNDWKVKSLRDLRKLFMKDEDEPKSQEHIEHLEKIQEEMT